ncbi:hypothetical protein EWM64_g2355 [Hericium alpestre]|uniref:F-box domain-containing protein n=1 Tax=Hericium alpestre TaxID=135208 RepID=A0A4Z0A5Q7_9AGAM|nr:hypothetical protein EWM64_g2355 [Hericium alpestre]
MRGSYDLVVPWLRSHAPNIGPVQSFVLHECWPDGVEIVAQDRRDLAPETSPLNLSDEDDGSMLRIVLRSMHRPRDFVPQIRRICDAFRLEEVEHVDVFINSWWKPQDWLDIFGRARRVEHADIGSKCASSFFDALAANCNRDHTTDLTPNDTPLLFPSLKVLELRVVDFYERARDGGYLWERIRDKLRLRRSIAPLKTLEMDSCRVHAEEVDELKGLVSHVSWDEKETGYGSTDDFISESEDDDDM